MITAIECATMHSGFTEQDIKDKFPWVIPALNEFASCIVLNETNEQGVGIIGKEQMFSQTEIEQLQSEVYKITGKGEVMQLFNKMLGVSAM